MAAKVPGFSDYQTDPFELEVTTAGVAIPLTTWDAESGATAILTVQVPADGQSVALRTAASTAAVTAFPDSSTSKAKRDDAAGINLVFTSLPVARSRVADELRLVSSATFNAICRWLPVTEAGD